MSSRRRRTSPDAFGSDGSAPDLVDPSPDAAGAEPVGTRAGRRADRGSRKGRGGFAVLLALLVIAGLLGGTAYGVMKVASKLTSSPAPADFPGPGTGSVVIRVKSGQTAEDIATTLKQAGVVQSRGAFLDAAKVEPLATKIQPGYYELKRQMAAADALTRIVDGSAKAERKVLIREGMRLKDILVAVSKGTEIPLAQLQAVVKQPEAIGLPDYAKGNAEGFLFPATYEFAPKATATEVLKQMVARFLVEAKKLGIGSGEVDPRNTVIIASMLEAEVNHHEDYGKAARVVENRLAKGEPLGFDSALHYYFGDNRALTTDVLQNTVTPYNLRYKPGLPPTPISSPGAETLKAALNPTPGDWRWFLTIDPKTGETKFYEKYNDFTADKRKYHIDY